MHGAKPAYLGDYSSILQVDLAKVIELTEWLKRIWGIMQQK